MKRKINNTLITIIMICISWINSGWTASAGTISLQQEGPAISGKVIDGKGAPIELATVQINSTSASQSEEGSKSTFTDKNGAFQFNSIPEGEYLISVSMMGYQSVQTESIQVASNSSTATTIPSITLAEEATGLATVSVTAQRPLIERRPDMMVVNVENSTLSAGNSAMEILERAPGIIIDKDGNISLMGKQGVLVMINGRQTNLSSEQLANLLRNTDGNTIKSVELITNPSAKYEASGSSGIINIVMKKNLLAGTNGNVTLSAGYGLKHKSNTSVNINHKTEKLNVYGTFSYLNNGGEQIINLDRNINHSGVQTFFGQSSAFDRLNQNISYRSGLDYQTSERNTLSFEVNGYNNGNNNDNFSRTLIGQNNHSLDSTLISLANSTGRFNSIGGNLTNQFDIDSNGRKLVAQLDISRFYRNNETAYTNTFFLPDGELMKQPELSNSLTPTSINIQVAKLDYTHPLQNGAKFESGFRYSQVKSDNEMQFDIQKDGQWASDPGRSNQFIYDEHISAAYANYQQQFGKLGLQGGLRAEYTVSTGNSVTLNSQVRRDYLDIFPSVFLNYALSDRHQTGISYSKRVNRPNYNLMNPFSYFLDQYTSERGNPHLRPEYAHVLEASYSLNSKYHLTLGYNFTNDAIVETMSQDDENKTTEVFRDNLAKQTNAYANLSVPVRIARFWSTNTNVTAFYLGFKGTLNDNRLNQGQYALNLRNGHQFTILPTLNAEMAVNYNSPMVYSIYRIGEQWSIDMGLSKSILQKRGNIKLAVSDVFNTRKHHIRTNYGNLNVFINQRHETRIARLTFSYSFGSTKNTSRRESRVEEKNRVGNP